MVSQSQAVVPPTVHLETIYEESGGSFASSVIDGSHQKSAHQAVSSPLDSSNYATHGLISARSIPSVDVHRRQRHRRHDEHQNKPPIEVRFRDGSKRYIPPATIASPNAILKHARKNRLSSRYDLTSIARMPNKYRPLLNTLPKHKSHPVQNNDVLLTIITTEQMQSAGVSPSLISSPDESETVTLHDSSSISSTVDTCTANSLKHSHRGKCLTRYLSISEQQRSIL
jgi:hypothetical protein